MTLGALVGCGDNLPKDSVARVGTTLIPAEQFETLRAVYEAAGRAPNKKTDEAGYARFEQRVAEYLVTMEVLRQKAPALKISVTDADVQAEIAKLKGMFAGDEQRFAEALAKEHLTPELLEQAVRDNLLLDQAKKAVTGDLSVTDAEAKAYYESHKSDFVQQEEREARHILISPFRAGEEEPTEADWEAARAEAEKVRGEIMNGANFSSEAAKYSDDTATKDSGGKLGLISRGQMVPAFEDAVFSLKKGELSEPVKTQYGYHLIEVIDIVPEKQRSYEEVAENIKSTLLARKQAEAWQTWLAEQQRSLGVEYKDGLEPPTTVSNKSTTTTAKTTTTGESIAPSSTATSSSQEK